MAYTLTQARTLLSANELALFDASRAQPIKALTPARLRGKVTRARALRDKYRDLYRRQTVSTRAAPAGRRSAVGGDNERTQRKAELFAEVLVRFEERLQRLQADAAKAQAKAKPVPLKAAVTKALKTKAAKAPAPRQPAQKATRSAKAPAAKRPTTAAKKSGSTAAAARLDVAPAAERRNPLRQRSDNLAIHAHSKSQARRSQGKRDSRG
ncbi:MAG TPA: hypothetical protein VMS38_03305 [Pseudorhodoferax sp.]|nr:hypothetical protein [Pseudorhodoferax sp.]